MLRKPTAASLVLAGHWLVVAALAAVYLAATHAIGAWVSGVAVLWWMWLSLRGFRRAGALTIGGALWPLMPLLLWALLSLLWSSPDSTAPGRLLPLFSLAVLAAGLLHGLHSVPGFAFQLVFAMVFAAEVSSLAAMVCWGAGGEFCGPIGEPGSPSQERLQGLGRLDNAVVAGGTWALGAALAIGVVSVSVRMSWRLLAGQALVVLVIAVLLTQSRGPLLAVGVALVLAVTLSAQYRWLLSAGGAGIAALVAAAVWYPELFQRFSLAGIESRQEVWQMAWGRFLEAPLVGAGAGSPEVYSLADGRVLEHAHSVLASMSVALGLVGIGACSWLLVVAVSRARRTVARGRGLPDGDAARAIALIGLVTLGAGLVAGLVDGRLPFTRVDEAWLLVWLPVLLCLGAPLVPSEPSQVPR